MPVDMVKKKNKTRLSNNLKLKLNQIQNHPKKQEKNRKPQKKPTNQN